MNQDHHQSIKGIKSRTEKQQKNNRKTTEKQQKNNRKTTEKQQKQKRKTLFLIEMFIFIFITLATTASYIICDILHNLHAYSALKTLRHIFNHHSNTKLEI